MGIKIKFADQWDNFRPEETNLFRWLEEAFGVELSDRPDYVIAGPFGDEHMKYDCVKIAYTGENYVPDFNLFDYAVGFDDFRFGDRYLRFPLFALRAEFQSFRQGEAPSDECLLNRGFCSFVVSNPRGNPIRERFFHELSKYRQVASGGKVLNNVGGLVADKMAFTAKYKFAIAFENSDYPGHVTEKILDPLAAWSVPVYWGAPDVANDFVPASFVRVADESDIQRAVDEIVRLDKDDAAYLAMCRANPLVKSPEEWKREFVAFFANVFRQGPEKARRVADYGFQKEHYRPELQEARRLQHVWNAPFRAYRKFRCTAGPIVKKCLGAIKPRQTDERK